MRPRYQFQTHVGGISAKSFVNGYVPPPLGQSGSTFSSAVDGKHMDPEKRGTKRAERREGEGFKVVVGMAGKVG